MGWLTAADALRILAVRPQTLYANVSRRRIRARPDPKDPRRSLYHEADVLRIARSRSGTRRAERVAAGAIEWGDPILPSGISTVAAGRLWYRGEDAVELADSRTLEQIAALLWGGAFGSLAPGTARRPRGSSARVGKARTGAASRDAASMGAAPTDAASMLSRALVELAARAAADPPSHGRALSVLRVEAADVLSTLARAVLGEQHDGMQHDGMLHERLARRWRCPRAADVLRRALVLLADHELNASTFAVRVAVSTGASLASGVLAGLATLSGPLHGTASLGVSEMVRAGRKQGMDSAIREWLAQGRPLAGFGHPLYPDGDVRADALLRASPAPARYEELRAVAEKLVGERPSVDFALAALTESFRLPADAPLTLFALGRCVGWLAHALEQVAAGRLIRPRARYVGPPVAGPGPREPSVTPPQARGVTPPQARGVTPPRVRGVTPAQARPAFSRDDSQALRSSGTRRAP